MDYMIEQKYAFPACSQHALLEWLRSTCVKDSEYSENLISSIYYDTPLFNSYAEKRGSGYRKTKVRLRWYLDLDALEEETSYSGPLRVCAI